MKFGCKFVYRDDPLATAELNGYIQDRVLEQISPKHISPNLVCVCVFVHVCVCVQYLPQCVYVSDTI